jgi:hypothetical protein
MYKYVYILSVCLTIDISAALKSHTDLPKEAQHVYTFIAAGYTFSLADVAHKAAEPVDALRIVFDDNGQETERKHLKLSFDDQICDTMAYLLKTSLAQFNLAHLSDMTGELKVVTNRFGYNEVKLYFQALKDTPFALNSYAYPVDYPYHVPQVGWIAARHILLQRPELEQCLSPEKLVLTEGSQRVICNTLSNSYYYYAKNVRQLNPQAQQEASNDFYQ